jgi:hypothetical protein
MKFDEQNELPPMTGKFSNIPAVCAIVPAATKAAHVAKMRLIFMVCLSSERRLCGIVSGKCGG